MKKYVLGFRFSSDFSKVVLILKNKPDWQHGCFNGLGGSIEEIDIDPFHAMIREFKEEAGVDTKPTDWEQFAIMSSSNNQIYSNNWEVYVFRSFGDLNNIKEREIEEGFVQILDVDNVINNTIPDGAPLQNIPWLLLLALDMDKKFSQITYH